MRFRIGAFAALVILFGASIASAAPFIHGRGTTAQAKLYASVIDGFERPVQIYNRLCPDAKIGQDCVPAGGGLRPAIDAAVDVDVRWVHTPRKHAGDFWVLGPIRFSEEWARFAFSYRRLGPEGCRGGGTRRFRLVDHEWVLRGGSEQVGCGVPAPVPHKWHARFFRAAGQHVSHVGVEISNVPLRKPQARHGTPVQVSGNGFPKDAIGIVIASDPNPPDYARVARLPLSDEDLAGGSALAGQPTLDVAWFRSHGKTYVVTIKTGANATRADRRTANAVVISIGEV